jgi:hypothetical protein
VIAYLTSDTTLKVVEGHLKGLEVQFQQIVEIARPVEVIRLIMIPGHAFQFLTKEVTQCINYTTSSTSIEAQDKTMSGNGG